LEINANQELYSLGIGNNYGDPSSGRQNPVIKFSRDGKFLGVATRFTGQGANNGKNIKIFDLDSGIEIQSFSDNYNQEEMIANLHDLMGPTSVDFSYDNKLIAVGYIVSDLTQSATSEVDIWDVQTGNLVARLQGDSLIPQSTNCGGSALVNEGGITRIAFSPDSTILSALAMGHGNCEATIYFWEVSTGTIINKIDVQPMNAILWSDYSEIGFSSNGKYFFAIDKIYGIK
jgi:WD40 repeat protein